MALRPWGDGPYGFSFELKRTLLVSSAVGGWVTGLVLASDSAGLTRAPAAPALNNCANLRREIVMLFIGILRPEFIVRSAPNCEIEKLNLKGYFVARSSLCKNRHRSCVAGNPLADQPWG